MARAIFETAYNRQIQQTGKHEETLCRFCKTLLPLWSETLAHAMAPRIASVGDASTCQTVSGALSTSASPSRPLQMAPDREYHTFNVTHQGKTINLPCRPGKEGEDAFRLAILSAFGLDSSWEGADAVVDFDVPTLDGRVTLLGLKAVSVAIKAANISRSPSCGR